MSDFIRTQAGKVWDEIRNHVVRYAIATVVGGSGLVLIATLRVWIFAKHTVALWGWLLVIVGLLCLCGVVLPIIMLIGKSRRDDGWIDDETDVKNLLREYLRDNSPRYAGTELVWEYWEIDDQLHFKSGCASRYLPEVMKENGQWEIISPGKETIKVRFGPSPREHRVI